MTPAEKRKETQIKNLMATGLTREQAIEARLERLRQQASKGGKVPSKGFAHGAADPVEAGRKGALKRWNKEGK